MKQEVAAAVQHLEKKCERKATECNQDHCHTNMNTDVATVLSKWFNKNTLS